LVIFYAKNLEKINDPLFNERVGGGIEGRSRKKTFESFSVVVNLAFFLGRRIAFIASVIFLDNFLWAQLAIQIMLSVFMIIFLLTFWPLESFFAVRMAVMDECTVLLLSYGMMCFTDFVPEPETRSEVIGTFYMGVLLLNVFIHLIFLMLDFGSKSKIRCKRCLKIRKVRRLRAKMRTIQTKYAIRNRDMID